jgi:hypothetical protein
MWRLYYALRLSVRLEAFWCPGINDYTVCRILIKLFIESLYKNLLGKIEFRKSWFIARHNFLNSGNEFPPEPSIFLDKLV